MPEASLPSAGRYQIQGRYQLESRIAAGGVGEVWRAVDTVLDRPVAVKLLRDEYVQDVLTRARFRAEARHAGGLSHPGVAQVYDYGENDPEDRPYLVMELVDGPSLATVLAGGPLEPAQAMDVIAQAAAGLQAAHQANLIHRDIKPANLLLGPGGLVKITDFGIAHAAGSAPVTRTGLLIGTPAYLAPERVSGAAATTASDLYSLGVVGYECLVGAPPFTGTPLEVAAAHRARPLPPLPASVPPPVAALVRALTSKDPAARPATAGQVAEQAARLRDALTGRATGELGAGAAPLAARPAGTPSAGAATLAYALPGPHGDTEAGAAETLPPGSPPPYRTRPGRRRLLTAAAGVLVLIAGLAGWLLSIDHGGAAAARNPSARPAHSTAFAQMVEISPALVGLPVRVVTRRLRQLGLRVHVTLRPAADQQPGTVLFVQPTGLVRAGSLVEVTAARSRPDHPHGHDHGNGGGHGHGHGGD